MLKSAAEKLSNDNNNNNVVTYAVSGSIAGLLLFLVAVFISIVFRKRMYVCVSKTLFLNSLISVFL